MNLMSQKAEIIARIAHRGQVDKCDVDYCEHLKAVAGKVNGDDEKTVAWLHDIVEDTPMGLEDLRTLGFHKSIVKAVELLTHTHEHTHADYVRRIRDAEGYSGRLARVVKLADLEHNADPARGSEKDFGWLRRRYAKSKAILEERTTADEQRDSDFLGEILDGKHGTAQDFVDRLEQS